MISPDIFDIEVITPIDDTIFAFFAFQAEIFFAFIYFSLSSLHRLIQSLFMIFASFDIADRYEPPLAA